MTTNQKQIGCIDRLDYGTTPHQLQLWLDNNEHGTQWTLRNAYIAPGGQAVRSCVLDSGSNTDYTEARRLGQEVFDRVKAEELAKTATAPAAITSQPEVVS